MTINAPRALVTGAGKRIGKELALALGRAGFAVAVHYRNSPDQADHTVADIVAAGGQAIALPANLLDRSDVESLIPRAAQALGGHISILVNSAAAFRADTAQTYAADGWDMHMNLNLRAPIRLAHCLDRDLPSGARGVIVNLIDHRVWKLNPTYFTYTLSKSALWTATRTLAQALAPRIRVNAIGPGAALPNDQESRADFDREIASSLTQSRPSPEMIAQTMLYLIEAEAVTGQMIAVDGGQHLVWQTPDLAASHQKADRSGPEKTDYREHRGHRVHADAEYTPHATRDIFIDGLELDANIGIRDAEKERKQPLRIYVRLSVRHRPIGDTLPETIDYGEIASRVRETVAERSYGLVETLADRIAHNLIGLPDVRDVEVRIEKPEAIGSVLPGISAVAGVTTRLSTPQAPQAPQAPPTPERRTSQKVPKPKR